MLQYFASTDTLKQFVFVQKAPKPTYIIVSLLCSSINIFLKLSKTTTSIHLDSHQFHFVLVRSFSPYKCLEQELCWIVLGFAKPTFSMQEIFQSLHLTLWPSIWSHAMAFISLFLRTNTEDTLEFHIFSMHIKVKMNPKVTLGQQTSRAYAFPAIATTLEQRRFFFNSPVQKSYHKK